MPQRNRRVGTEQGATAIEYGLIAALVAVVIITGLTALGTSLNEKFDAVASTVEPASPAGGEAEPTVTPSPSATSTVAPVMGDDLSSGSPATESATPAPGEEEPRILSDALCWLGPGSAYEVASAVRAGSPLEILGVGLGGGWLVVNNPHFPGVLCWIPVEAVELPVAFATPERVYPIPPVPTSTPEPKKKEGCIVKGKCEVPCPVPNPDQYPLCYQ